MEIQEIWALVLLSGTCVAQEVYLNFLIHQVRGEGSKLEVLFQLQKFIILRS